MQRLTRTIVLCLGFTVIATGMALSARQPKAAGQQASATSLRHVVLFKFKDDATAEQIDQIVTAFKTLPSKIGGITAFEWGTNNSPEGLADGFTHCFVVTFKDTQSRDAYLPHQAHKDFVAILRPRLDKVLVVDYFAQK